MKEDLMDKSNNHKNNGLEKKAQVCEVCSTPSLMLKRYWAEKSGVKDTPWMCPSCDKKYLENLNKKKDSSESYESGTSLE